MGFVTTEGRFVACKAVSCKTLIGALNAFGCLALGSCMYCPPASESENMSLYVWDPTMQEPFNKHLLVSVLEIT